MPLSLATQGDCTPRRLAQTQGRRWAESTRPPSARPRAHTRRRKALGEASQHAVCVHSNDGNRVCVGAGVDDHFYSLRRDITVRAARGKQKDGAGLSQDDRRARGLELTLEEESLFAGQVNMLCVYAQVMEIVYACVKVLIVTCARWMHVV